MMAVGERGTILHTTDGGSNWSPQSSGTSTNLWSVHLINGNEGWAVGSLGPILHYGPEFRLHLPNVAKGYARPGE